MKTVMTQIYVEGKVTPVHAMKIYRVGVEWLLHSFWTRSKCVVNYTSSRFTRGGSPSARWI